MRFLHHPLAGLGLALSLTAPAGWAGPAAPPAQAPAVQRQGQGWLLQPQGQGLAALAQALAQQSGSRLAGAVQALNPLAAPTGQAQWRVASLDQAWALLLDGRVSHARQCQGQGSRQRCTLWLTGVVAGAAAGAATVGPTPGTTLAAPGMPPNAPPSPAPAAMPTSDPPGLFPSQIQG